MVGPLDGTALASLPVLGIKLSFSPRYYQKGGVTHRIPLATALLFFPGHLDPLTSSEAGDRPILRCL
jgi:hypothetical protein